MFDKTFCINLDKRPDRWEECQDEFKKIVWPVERFPGIAGHFNKSQYDCIKAASVFESSLILEDDVAFRDLSHLQEALSALPANWDLVSLGSTLLSKHRQRVHPNLYLYVNGWATQAIGYSKGLMEWIIDHFNPDGGVIYDEWLRINVLPNFKCFIVKPMVAYQRPSFSDIRNRKVDYVKGFEESQKLLV